MLSQEGVDHVDNTQMILSQSDIALTWRSNLPARLLNLQIDTVNQPDSSTGTFLIATVINNTHNQNLLAEFAVPYIMNGKLYVHKHGISDNNAILKHQCVALVQAVTTNQVKTEFWKKGVAASGFPENIVNCHCVATFHGTNETYDTPPDYDKQHTGVFMAKHQGGIIILSQNMSNTGLDLRRFLFSSTGKVSGGNNYSLITL